VTRSWRTKEKKLAGWGEKHSWGKRNNIVGEY
jgi:hypothetical protein